MGAAQDQRVHPGLPQGRQILPGHRLHHHIAPVIPPVLHQGDEQGAGLGDDGGIRLQGQDLPLVGPGADGGGGGDEADAPAPGYLDGPGAGGVHHPQDGQVVFLPQLGEGVGGHGAAGHHDGLDVERAEKAHVLPGVFQQRLPAASAVRHTGRVAKVYNVLRGQDAPNLRHGGKPAQAGVEHPDGTIIHVMTPHFFIN